MDRLADPIVKRHAHGARTVRDGNSSPSRANQRELHEEGAPQLGYANEIQSNGKRRDDVCCWAVIFIGGIFYISYVMDQRSGQKLENTNTNYNALTMPAEDTYWNRPRASLGGNVELQYAPTTDTITDMLESAAKSSNFTDELDKDVKKAKNRKKPDKNTIPLEWKQLKEIYPEAEMKEYSDYNNFMNGNWDKEGLREDLELMIKRTGKTPKDSYSDDEDSVLT